VELCHRRCHAVGLRRCALAEIADSQATTIVDLGGGPHVTTERLMARLGRQQRLIGEWLEHRPQIKVLEVSYAEIRERPSAAVIAVSSSAADWAGMRCEVDTRRKRATSVVSSVPCPNT